MSRTVFLNVCSQLKVSCSHAIDYKQGPFAYTVVDVLGSVDVPEFHFLATYEFQGNAFHGAGSTKRSAAESLFARLVASKYMPKAQPKVDPTLQFDDDFFVIVTKRNSPAVSLSIHSPDESLIALSPITLVPTQRGRHEALMSLIRSVMREHPEKF